MAVQWWQHGVCVECAKQTRFATSIFDDLMKVSSPRSVATQTCGNNELSLVIWKESLSMMIGRAVGWMEWSGAVSGVSGLGLGLGEGEGRGMGGE